MPRPLRVTVGLPILLGLMLVACSEDLQPPTARIEGPAEGVVGQVVELSGAGSTASEGGTLSYLWSFVEVPASSEAAFNDASIVNPSFTPDVAGTYTVALIVREGDLTSAPATLTVEVSVCGAQAPVVASLSSLPESPGVGDLVRMLADVSDGDNSELCNLGQRLSYSWTLRSRPTGSLAAFDDPGIPSPTLVTDQPGNYEIELVVSDSTGLRSDVADFLLEVGVCGGNDPVVESLEAEPAAAVTGDVITLSAQVSDPDNLGDCAEDQALSLRWRMAGVPPGSRATLVGQELLNPFFVADVAGEYVVQLVVTDDTGRSSQTGELSIDVLECGTSEPVIEAINADPTSPNTGEQVRLIADVSDPDTGSTCGDPDLYTYDWRLTNVPPGSEASLSRRDVSNPTLTPDVPGDYVIRLDVTDLRGLPSRPVTTTLTAAECGSAPPQADPEANVEEPVVGDEIVLSANVTDQDEWDGTDEDTCRLEETFTYEWSFRELPPGSSASLTGAGSPNAGFVPDAPGTYVIEIRVTDSDGHTTITRVVIVVEADTAPNVSALARVGADPFGGAVAGLTPLTVEFQCTSSSGEPPFTTRWSLGNGVSSTEPDPVYTFTEGGRFVASCQVTDRNGDVDSDTVTVDVTLDSTPDVRISASPLTGLVPPDLEVQFASVLVAPGNGTLHYRWDYGLIDGAGDPVTLEGDLGDPSGPDIESPSTSYASAGTYRVVLTVTDEQGDVASDSLQVAVGTDSLPAVSVSAEPATGIEPLTVRLVADVAGGDAPLVYFWDLGLTETDGCAPEPGSGSEPNPDNCTVRAQNPVVTYTVADDVSDDAVDGVFSARVWVEDADGDVVVGETPVTILAEAAPQPVVEVLGPDGIILDGDGNASGLSPLLVELGCHSLKLGDDGNIELDADGDPIPVGNPPFTYLWDFGDGETATAKDVTHVYELGGDFTAVCTVTDANGDSAAAGVGVSVEQDDVPRVLLGAEPLVGLAPLAVTFSVDVLDAGNGTLDYVLTFGDAADTVSEGVVIFDDSGNAFFDEGPSPDGTADVLSFPYGAAGTYQAALLVADEQEDVALSTVQIGVGTDSQPAVVALAEPQRGIEPLEVAFRAEVAGGEPPLLYEWDFDDDGVIDSNAANPVHRYETDGTYDARLTVTDADDDEGGYDPADRPDEGTVTITVDADTPVNAEVSAVPDTSTTGPELAPVTVTFTCESVVDGTDTPTGNEPLSYFWTFGDGATSTLPNPTHTYATPSPAGGFAAECSISDADGNPDDDDSASVIVEVLQDLAPEVSIAADPTEGVWALEVDFGSSASGGNGGIVHYRWTFGDGEVFEGAPDAVELADDGDNTVGDIEAPVHTYQNPGTYVARLVVTDDDGDTASDDLTIRVLTGSAPVVSATAEPSEAVDDEGAGVDVQLTAVIEGGDTPLTVEWDFDYDGITFEVESTEQNPVHTYVFADDGDGDGVFSPAVRVEDRHEESDLDTVTVTLTQDQTPAATITSPAVGTHTGVAPWVLELSCEGSGGDGALSFLWDFDDGATSTIAALSHTYLTAGTFFPSCGVTDADGDVDVDGDDAEELREIVVQSDSAPVVSLNARPLRGLEQDPPLQVTFIASVTSGNGQRSYVFDFGNGDTHTGSVNPNGTLSPNGHPHDEDGNLVHPYGASGTYVARLTVTDGDAGLPGGGEPETASSEVTIQVEADLEAGVTASADPVLGDDDPDPAVWSLTVDFGATATGNLPGRFEWDFDDGSGFPADCAVTPDVPACQQNPQFTYASAGVYFPTVRFVDANGDVATDSVRVVVNAPPVADAGPDQCAVHDPAVRDGLVVLDGSASVDPETAALSYSWAFLRKPATSTARLNDPGVVNPSFAPDRLGVYRLRLTVSDGIFAATDEVEIEVLAEPSAIAFTAPTTTQVARVTQLFRAALDTPTEPASVFVAHVSATCTQTEEWPVTDPVPDWPVEWSGSDTNATPTAARTRTDGDGDATNTARAGEDATPEPEGATLTAAIGTASADFSDLEVYPGPPAHLVLAAPLDTFVGDAAIGDPDVDDPPMELVVDVYDAFKNVNTDIPVTFTLCIISEEVVDGDGGQSAELNTYGSGDDCAPGVVTSGGTATVLAFDTQPEDVVFDFDAVADPPGVTVGSAVTGTFIIGPPDHLVTMVASPAVVADDFGLFDALISCADTTLAVYVGDALGNLITYDAETTFSLGVDPEASPHFSAVDQGSPTPTLVTWRLDGVVFDDGGSASGYVVYDTGTGQIVDWHIQVAGGDEATYPPLVYDTSTSFVTDQPFEYEGFTDFIVADDFSYVYGTTRDMRLSVAGDLAEPRVAPLAPAPDPSNFTNRECLSCESPRLATGSLVGAVKAMEVDTTAIASLFVSFGDAARGLWEAFEGAGDFDLTNTRVTFYPICGGSEPDCAGQLISEYEVSIEAIDPADGLGAFDPRRPGETTARLQRFPDEDTCIDRTAIAVPLYDNAYTDVIISPNGFLTFPSDYALEECHAVTSGRPADHVSGSAKLSGLFADLHPVATDGSCGDGFCNVFAGETADPAAVDPRVSCPDDCLALCGDGYCDSANGENGTNCAPDCSAAGDPDIDCGDAICDLDAGEHILMADGADEVCTECDGVCGDGYCEEGIDDPNCPDCRGVFFEQVAVDSAFYNAQVVSWVDVPEADPDGVPVAGSSNTFQIRYDLDGQIVLTYLDATSPHALVGISDENPGGLLPQPEVDFSTAPGPGAAAPLALQLDVTVSHSDFSDVITTVPIDPPVADELGLCTDRQDNDCEARYSIFVDLPVGTNFADCADSDCVTDPVCSEQWINELHYDNVSDDVDEFVEIAGVTAVDLGLFELYLYNGSDGGVYGTVPLQGAIDDDESGLGAVAFPYAGIQNGGPDGLALVWAPTRSVAQFLSYEGTFTATEGPAAGMTSVDIGVSESNASTPVGSSLGLAGCGDVYGDFFWQQNTGTATPGDFNEGQYSSDTCPE